jgi:hypothetical protein
MEVAQQEILTQAPAKETTRVSGSVALLEALIAEGVDTIFGYPGGAIMPIYDALYGFVMSRAVHMPARVMRVHRAKWVWFLQPAAPALPT